MREMKDSGIEWIGAIPTTWHTQKMKYISNFIQNKYSSDYGLLPYIGLENIASWSGSFISTNSQYDREQSLICEPEDILFGKLRPYLAKVYMNDRLCCCSNEFAVIRVNGQNKRYMWYQLLSHGFIFEIDRSTYGTKMPRANAEFIRNVFVALPSEIEQQKIANYLDKMCAEIDAVLEKTRASIEEYKKLKQAVITQAVTKGIRGDRPMKDSGIEWIGEISQDFEIVKLKWLCDVLDQFRSPVTADKRNQNADVLYDYYGASGAIDKIDGYTIDDHVMLIGEDGANLRMRSLPIMYEINGKAWVNNHAHILKPKAGVDFYFIFYALEALDLNYYITGSAQPKLSQDNLRNIWVPITDFTGQKRIAAYISDVCDEFDCLIAKKQQYLTEIENYKKSLIYEYVTGKKEVI